ncbi:MAG: phage tail protein [Alphaproteobacteria bacterium]|nr:phage tail protein [Alphaproteobacteria bacterium]
MTAQKGSLVLLKIGDGGAPEQFTTVGGLRVNRFEVRNAPVDASNRDSGRWQSLLAGTGNSRVTLEGSGVFTDSATEKTLRIQAFNHTQKNYRMTFGNGDALEGPFVVSAYAREGDVDGEERYALTLESSGSVTFAPAS